MKKTLTTALALIMVLSLTACGGDTPASQAQSSSSSAAPSSSTASVASSKAESNVTSKDTSGEGEEWKNFIGTHTSFASLTDTKDTFSVASDGTVSCNFEGTVFTGDMSKAVQQSGQKWTVALEHGGASYTGEIILANEGVYSRFDIDIKTSDDSHYVSSKGNKAVLAIND